MQPCCDSRTVCEGGVAGSANLDFDTPFANLSAETPDINQFVGINWGWNNNVPRIGSNWTANSCLGVCESSISQADADACAARANLYCLSQDGGGVPPPPTPGVPGVPLIYKGQRHLPYYENQPQTCIANCPDGLGFAYTVPAGKYASFSQTIADRMAMSEACRYSVNARICLGTLATAVCVGHYYESTLTATGGTAPLVYTVVAGSLPPGLFIELLPEDPRTMVLHGTATTGGVYTFTIRVDDALGRFMQKTFTITVTGIDNASLPDGTVGTAYSETLTAATMTVPLTWSVSAGALPDGLSLNSASGAIYGTPTTAQTSTFTVKCLDGTGLSCTHDYTVTIVDICWIVAQSGSSYVPPIMEPTGTSLALDGGVNYVFRNQALSAIASPSFPDFPDTAGGAYGLDIGLIPNRHYYTSALNVTTYIGASGGDFINYYGLSDTGRIASVEITGGQQKIRVYEAGVMIAQFGIDAGLDAGDIGPTGHVLWGEFNGVDWDFYIWRQDTGQVSLGFHGSAGILNSVNVSGHAALNILLAGKRACYFWNGVTTALIYAPASGIGDIGLNSSDTIAGAVSNSNVFKWTQGGGVSLLGLPGGAASVAHVWITDAGVIIAQTNIGAFYYWNGVWAALGALLPAGWTSVNIDAVTHDGYAEGNGTNGGITKGFWCKLCSPP